MTAADVNSDGYVDVVIANHDTDHLTLLLGDGTGRFTAREVRVHSNPHPHMIAAADVDRNGRIDLITDSWMENRLTLVRADANGAWQTPGTPIEVGRKPYWTLTAADLDGDGNVDLVVPNEGRGTVSVLFGDGHGHFAHGPGSPIAAGPAPFSATVGDVNSDGRLDVVVANYSGHITDSSRDGVTWMRNDGGRRFTPFAERVVTARGSARVAVGDVNGDGFADAAVSNGGASDVTIVFGSPDGLGRGISVATMPGPDAIALVDLDHNRRADLLVTTENRDELLVFRAR